MRHIFFHSVRVCTMILVCNSITASAADFDGTCMKAPVSDMPSNDRVIRVSSESALQQAIGTLSNDTLVLIAPGVYQLTSTLVVNYDNVTIRGDSNRCDDVVLIGEGMENAAGVENVPHGIWTNAADLRVENLTIKDVYYHAIMVSGSAESPSIYNVRMVDIGEQFVKVSPQGFANGVDNGSVEYSVMQYTTTPPLTDHGGGTGYTNGVDVHAGKNWVISNNRFENFHTADNSQNLWNPAILVWNGAANTLAENNTFVNVDRAIAFGLIDRTNDHSGGIIRNNMIVMRAGLFSEVRRQNSDAPIIVWSSPGTKVLHNTVVTQGNTNSAIQLRFDSNDVVIKNNLISAPIRDRSSNSFVDLGNVLTTDTEIFSDPDNGDLHLATGVEGITGVASVLADAPVDFDGDLRSSNQTSDVGADEYRSGDMCIVD